VNTDLIEAQKRHLSEKLSGKTIMVSGSTGLIGSSVVRYLLGLNDNCNANVTVVALHRNEAKAISLYPEERDDLLFLACSDEGLIQGDVQIDSIVHAAGISGGTKLHLKDPVKVFETGIRGTKWLLDYAVEHGCEGFCYVSTYEIYGYASREGSIKENDPCLLDPMVLRNSYAEVKRVCESMLTAYSAAYKLKVFSARLMSTFGAGVAYEDPRFFAEFARCVIEGRNIELKSSGGTIRNYLDVDDAASAFLYILAEGETGNAYNVANMANAFSINEMANMFASKSGEIVQVILDENSSTKDLGYRRVGRTVIDTNKLESLGWKPAYSIENTISKIIEDFRMKKAPSIQA